jgi:hypothetical protein
LIGLGASVPSIVSVTDVRVATRVNEYIYAKDKSISSPYVLLAYVGGIGNGASKCPSDKPIMSTGKDDILG